MDIQLKTGCFEDAALCAASFMDEQGYENEFDATTRIRTAFM